MSASTPGSNDGPPARDPGTQTVKAVVVTVVAVLIAVLVLHHHAGSSNAAVPAGSTTRTTKPPNSTPSTTSVTGISTTTTTTPPVSPHEIKLQVLNGVGTGNYSSEFSTKLHTTPGYNTLAPNNATAAVQASSIYIVTPGYLPEAKILATTLALPASVIVQTTPPPSTAPIPAADRTAADLVLVVGPDLVSKA